MQWNPSTAQLASSKNKSMLNKARDSLHAMPNKNISFSVEDLPTDGSEVEGQVVIDNFIKIHDYITRK